MIGPLTKQLIDECANPGALTEAFARIQIDYKLEDVDLANLAALARLGKFDILTQALVHYETDKQRRAELIGKILQATDPTLVGKNAKD